MILTCPLCARDVEVETCPQCGLTWREPSAQSVRMEPESPRSRWRSVTSRRDGGMILLEVVGYPVLIVPLVVGFLGMFLEGGLAILDGPWTGVLLRAAVCPFLVAAGYAVLANAWDVLKEALAPCRVEDGGEVLRVRAGGWGKPRARERAVAKADVCDVVVAPRANGFGDVWIVLKAGAEMRVAEGLPARRAERVGARIRSWFGEGESGEGGYRD